MNQVLAQAIKHWNFIAPLVEQPTSKREFDALKVLINAHQLRQTDLVKIGSQGVVSEILKGKRPLNLRQVKLLAKRFNVEPSTFIDD